MIHATQTALPFAGLGHDLAPVRRRAGLLTLRRVRQGRSLRAGAPAPAAPRPAGYGLLVRLSREIRGR